MHVLHPGMGLTLEKIEGPGSKGMNMGSVMGKHARTFMAVLLAVCMVAGLNPAAAFAATTPRNMDTGQAQELRARAGAYGTHVSEGTDGTGSSGREGAAISTEVGVAVKSAFAVVMDDTTPVDIDDARQLYQGAYVLEATLSGGNAIAGDAPHYDYRWVRQVLVREGDAAGTFADDEAYNEASPWRTTPIEAGSDSNEAHVQLDLADDAAQLDFRNQAQYRYTVVGRDGASISRTADPGVIVNCNAHYADQTVESDGVSVRGLIHVGDPALDLTDLLAQPGAALSLLLEAAAGKRLDCAFDMTITEQLAVNHGEPAYLAPLTSIRIPVSADAPAEVVVLRVAPAAPGAASAVEALGPFTVVEQDGERFVELVAGTAGLDSLATGIYAIAYTAADADGDPFPPVSVTSRVDAGGGGTVSILGERLYAQGTTVRYTFLPFTGYALSKVVVAEGDADRPDSYREYLVGATSDSAFGANYLDYTTVKLATPAEQPRPITITAYYVRVDVPEGTLPVQVDASVVEGEGSVSIDGGTEGAQGRWAKTIPAGSAATVRFNPEPGSVLDHAEMQTASGDRVRVEVLNGSLTLPAVAEDTSVFAYFRFGTPIAYPELTVSVDCGEHGSLSATSPVFYGQPSAVQALPDKGFRLAELWYTFDDDAHQVHYPLSSAGAGSHVVDHVLGNITVHARYTPATMPVKVESGTGGTASASYDKGDGTQEFGKRIDFPGETLTDVGASSDLVLTVVPDEGKQPVVNVVTKDGQTVPVLPDADGRFTIPNDLLKDAEKVTIDYVDMVPDTLSVNVSFPDSGAVVQRVGQSGALAPGEYLIGNIRPDAGLTLDVQLSETHEGLKVEVVDMATGNLIKDMSPEGLPGSTMYHFGSDLLGADKLIRVTCQPRPDLPPAPDTITVTASCTGGTISPREATVSGDRDVVEDVSFAIEADEGNALDCIVLSTADGATLTLFAANQDSGIERTPDGGWRFVLSSGRIKYDGYVKVHALMKDAPAPGVLYTVTPVLVDAQGNEVGSAEAHGQVSPNAPFTVPAGGSALLSFIPDRAGNGMYRAEYSVNGGPFTPSARGSLLLMGIQEDQTVRVRFVLDGTGEEREMHTVVVGVLGSGGAVQPAGSLQVAHRANLPVSFLPSAGYELSYVVVDRGTDAEAVYGAESLAATAGQFVLHDVTSDHTVFAVFVPTGAVDDLVKWTVSAGEHGMANPSGTVYAKISEGGKDIAITPDAGYVISEIRVNGQPVNFADDPRFAGTAFGGTFTLPAVEGGGGTFEVLFAPRAVQVKLHAKVVGSGGVVSPAGDTLAVVGQQQTLTFVPDAGYDLDRAYFTDSFGNPLEGGSITAAALAGNRYSYTFTVANETWVECSFKKLADGEGPSGAEDKRLLDVHASAKGEGVLSPSGNLKLYDDGSLTFVVQPKPGYLLQSLTLGGNDVAGQVQGGVFVLSGQAAAAAAKGDLVELKAVFAKAPEKYVDVEVSAGSGGTVSPSGTVQVIEGDSLPISMKPDPGKQVAAIELTFKNPDGTTYTQTIPWNGDTYTLPGVPGNLVEVHVRFEDAPAPKPPVSTLAVTPEVAYGSAGLGTVSPDRTVDITEGGSALFTFVPALGCEVVSVKLDGTEVAGRGALRCYISYEQLQALGGASHRLVVAFGRTEELPPTPPDTGDEEVTVTAEASGPGSVSPEGPFLALKGASQAFTFTYDNRHAYVESLTVTTGSGADALTETIDVWEFATAYTIGALSADTHVRVRFAESPDKENPGFDATEYVTITGVAVTGACERGAVGGAIHPAGPVRVVSGMNSQRFLFRAMPGYAVDSVTVQTGTGSDAAVRTLSADELALGSVIVAGVTADTTVVARFVPECFLVDVSSGAGGSLLPEGKAIKVAYGAKLQLLVQPEAGYELDEITTTGSVEHEGKAAQGVQTAGAQALDGRAGTLDRHTFAVGGSGTVYASFKTDGTGGTDVPEGRHAITASAAGHGQIAPEGQQVYAHGATAIFTLRPEIGYQPVSVTVKDAAGERTVKSTSTSFALVVESDGEVIAHFAPVSPAGSNTHTARLVRTLQSLAQTGDGAAVGFVALAGVACAAAGSALLLAGRRKKKEEA